MKLAILGGSYNPVHIGHLYLADSVLAAFDYNRVILVPAFQSPFKIGNETASPKDRMDMLMASIPGDPRLAIDDCEINREGVSYTIDTLKDIIHRYKPQGKPGLIIGDDLVSTFKEWRNPDEIAEIADIIIAKRLSVQDFPYPHRVLNNEIMNISSSEIREKIAKAEAWRYLIPSGARYIIESRSLYGFSYPGDKIDTQSNEIPDIINLIVFMEQEARQLLDDYRFNHSRNVALLAWDLSVNYGLDSHKAYLAGICHDLCKNLKDNELIRLAQKDGGSISKLEKKKPGLLHARAAAVQLKRKYSITDDDVLDAVRFHTTGQQDMGPLAKVIYIADKLESSRNNVDSGIRSLIYNTDIETLFSAVLGNTVTQLKARQLDLSYGTRRLLAAMEKREKN